MTTIKWPLAVVAAVLAFGGSAVAGDVKPNAVQSRAMDDIEDHATGIVGLAYPTAKSVVKTEYVKGTAYKGGSFDLTYKFTYKDSDGVTQSFTERFEFSAAGKLTDHATVSSTEFWPPFATLKLLGAVVDEIAKELDR
jgi:hypothetical protein